MRYFIFLLVLISSSASAAEYVITSQPRGTEEEERKIFEPIAEYLSSKTGEKFRYVYVRDWLTYRKLIARNSYDIYFSDPHFASFLVEYRNHVYLARFKEWLSFAVVVRADDKIGFVSQLAGRQNCLQLEPNLGTLLFMSSFENPTRQPAMVVVQDWEDAYRGVIKKKCSAAVVPYETFSRLNADNKTFALQMYDLVPSQVFTVNKKISGAVLDIVRRALLDPKNPAMQELFGAYASDGMMEVNPKDYENINAILLKDYVLGGEVARPKAISGQK